MNPFEPNLDVQDIFDPNLISAFSNTDLYDQTLLFPGPEEVENGNGDFSWNALSSPASGSLESLVAQGFSSCTTNGKPPASAAYAWPMADTSCMSSVPAEGVYTNMPRDKISVPLVPASQLNNNNLVFNSSSEVVKPNINDTGSKGKALEREYKKKSEEQLQLAKRPRAAPIHDEHEKGKAQKGKGKEKSEEQPQLAKKPWAEPIHDEHERGKAGKGKKKLEEQPQSAKQTGAQPIHNEQERKRRQKMKRLFAKLRTMSRADYKVDPDSILEAVSKYVDVIQNLVKMTDTMDIPPREVLLAMLQHEIMSGGMDFNLRGVNATRIGHVYRPNSIDPKEKCVVAEIGSVNTTNMDLNLNSGSIDPKEKCVDAVVAEIGPVNTNDMDLNPNSENRSDNIDPKEKCGDAVVAGIGPAVNTNNMALNLNSGNALGTGLFGIPRMSIVYPTYVQQASFSNNQTTGIFYVPTFAPTIDAKSAFEAARALVRAGFY